MFFQAHKKSSFFDLPTPALEPSVLSDFNLLYLKIYFEFLKFVKSNLYLS